VAFTREIGLDAEQFELDLNSESTEKKLNDEITMSRKIGAQGFPSLILKSNKLAETDCVNAKNAKSAQWLNVPYDYNDASVTLRSL
jgi:putative protein-disulfide isomerase